MAKKKTKKKPIYPKYFFGNMIDAEPPVQSWDWVNAAVPGLANQSRNPEEVQAQVMVDGASEATGDSAGDPNMAGPIGAIGAGVAAAGRAAGQFAHDAISVGLPFLAGMIPDNARQKRPKPQMAENPHPYGTGSSALYNYGGNMQSPFQANQGIVMPLASGQLQVEGNQYSFLSPETINVGGQPHSSGGTNVAYGGNMVEAEAGEPMSIGKDGQAVVWGNMYVPRTNTKFKGAAKKIAKEEKKNTQMLGKATKLIQGSNPSNPYEALSFGTGKALNDAAAQNQKKISAYKDSLATLQQAMLDYSERTGIKPDKLGKSMKKGGSIPMPKYKNGGCMECGGSFQDGGFVPIAGKEYGIASYPIFPPENDPEAPLAESGFHLNPAHKGWCTPMTKSTCTGKRRQFAINAKNHFKKQENGGPINGGQLPEVVFHGASDPSYDAMANVIMNRNKNLNFVDRAYHPENYPKINNPDGSYSTHLMAYDAAKNRVDNRMYPTIIQNPNGGLTNLGEGDAPYDYADSTGQYIPLPSAKMASFLSNKGYKHATGIPTHENGGTIGNVGDEIELSPSQLKYYRSLGYEFE